jgi:putative ATPase
MLEEEARAPVEVLTNSPTDRARDRWLQRTVSGAGARLARVRDALYEAARVQRHHLLLDVAAGSGLLVWEGVRRTPEGQIWAATDDPTHAAALRQQAARLDELERPVVLEADVGSVAGAVTARDPTVRFDRVLGRGALAGAADAAADAAALLAGLAELLTADGAILLAETDAARAQRLAALVDWSAAEALGTRVRACEETLYAGARAWDEPHWATLADAAGLTLATHVDVVVHGDQRISAEAVTRWFGAPDAPGAYARALAAELGPTEVEEVARRYRSRFAGQVVPWRTVVSVARLERRAR